MHSTAVPEKVEELPSLTGQPKIAPKRLATFMASSASAQFTPTCRSSKPSIFCTAERVISVILAKFLSAMACLSTIQEPPQAMTLSKER